MTAQQIKKAVDDGKRVFWKNPGYQVIKDSIGQYMIKSSLGGNSHFIGLTHMDGVTLNGEAGDFYTPDGEIPTILEFLQQGGTITFPSGYSLKGDPETNYLELYFDIGLGAEQSTADGLENLNEEGVKKCFNLWEPRFRKDKE